MVGIVFALLELLDVTHCLDKFNIIRVAKGSSMLSKIGCRILKRVGSNMLNKNGSALLNKLIISACLLSFNAMASTSFEYDGHFVASEYDKVFSIDYYYETSASNPTGIIHGGTLALTTYDGKQYMYISHPLDFKDLSYSKGANDKYSVGWDGQSSGNNKLGGAIDSEFMELTLTSDNTAYKVAFNPKKGDLGNTPHAGSRSFNDVNFSFLSTSDYNRSLFTTRPDWFDKHSPETLTPAEISGCLDETSSDPSCYQLKDTADNKVNGQIIDWDFNWGLEIELKRSDNALFFGDLASLDLSSFGYQTGDAVIRLDELHASDPKTISTAHHGQLRCADGTAAPNHGPCGAEVVAGTITPPTQVPEPSTTAIFALGLAALWFRRKQLQQG